jgi:hypothetical protein
MSGLVVRVDDGVGVQTRTTAMDVVENFQQRLTPDEGGSLPCHPSSKGFWVGAPEKGDRNRSYPAVTAPRSRPASLAPSGSM